MFDAVPSTSSLLAPTDMEENVSTTPTFSWSASTQVESYLIEVATDASFSNIVISETVDGTSFQPATPLSTSTEYFWRVTPTNFCGDAPESSVFSFGTQPAPGDCPIELATLTVFEDDMENGPNGWTLGDGSTQNTWQQTTVNPFSGATAWNAENVDSISDQRLVSPAIALPNNSVLPLTLRFQNFQRIENDGTTACWDGALLEISTDGGTNWTQLENEVLFREYDGTVNDFTTGPNPLAGSSAWCGDPRGYEDYVVDLSSFADQEVQFRFRLGTDGTIGDREGWTIDDVRVEACGSELLFEDGFETPEPTDDR